MNAEKLSTAPEGQKLSKYEAYGAGLIVLSFAMLPIGRVIVEIITVLMAILGLMLVCKKPSREELFNNRTAQFFSVLFALLWLPMLISVIDSDTLNNSAVFTLKYLRFFFAGVFAIHLLQSAKVRKFVLAGISVTVAILLVDGLIQWITGMDLLGKPYNGSRVPGPFRNITQLPVILSLSLTLVLIFINRRGPAYLFWGVFFLSVLILFLTGSRASWIALLLAALLYIGYIFHSSPKKPFLMIFLLTLSAMAIGVAGYGFDDGFKGRIDHASKIFAGDYDSVNQATSMRLSIWEAATRMALANPINGVGVKGFRDQYTNYAIESDPFKNTVVTHPHMFILEIFVESGVIGGLGLFLMLALLYRLTRNNLRQWTPLQAGSAITIAITFFPLNAHTSLYGSFYSQLAWFATAVACSLLFEAENLETEDTTT